MKRFFFLMLLSAVCIVSLAQQRAFHLKGVIDPAFNGKPIMLFTFSASDINRVHSVDTTVVKNGTFYFEGQPYVNNISLVSVGNYPERVLTGEVVLESGYITMNLDSICRIGGTNLNDLYQQYKDSSSYIRNLYAADIQMLINKEFAYMHPFIKANIRNAVGRTLFDQRASSLVTLENFNPIYELADDTLKRQKRVVRALELYKKRDEVKKRWGQLVGQSYQDFSFMSMEGKEEKLSDYVGKSKYLIVDVWASWCAPCRAEMPAWKEFLEKYKDLGFTILGISIDTDQKDWKASVGRLDMPWKQVVCQKDKVVLDDFYKLHGIPHTILIDQNGKIVLGSKFNAHQLGQYIEQGIFK